MKYFSRTFLEATLLVLCLEAAFLSVKIFTSAGPLLHNLLW